MKYLFLLISLFISGSAAAMPQADSLKNEIAHCQNYKDSIQILSTLGKTYANTELTAGIASGLEYYNYAINVAQLHHDEKSLIHVKIIKANLLLRTDTTALHQEVEKNLFEYVRKCKELHDTTDEAVALTNLGVLYNSLDSAVAPLYFDSAIQLFKATNDSFNIARVLVPYSLYLKNRGETQTSITYCLQALNVYTHCKNDLFMDSYKGDALISLGNSNIGLGNFGKALEFLQIAELCEEKAGAKKHLSGIESSISSCYKGLGKLDSALYHVQKALNLAKAISDLPSIAYSLTNIGCNYFALKKYTEAKHYLDTALILATQANFYHIQCVDLNMLAENCYMTKDYAGTIKIASDLASRAEMHHDKSYQMAAYQQIASSYANMEYYKNSYYYQKKSYALKDSLMDETKSRQIVKMQAKYDADNKGREIALLRKNSEILEASVLRKNAGMLSIIGGSVCLFIILFLMLGRRNLINQNRNEKTLHYQQQQNAMAILEAQEEERQRIAKDLQEGLGAYLNSLKLNMEVLKPCFPNEKMDVFNNISTSLNKINEELRAIAGNLVADTLQHYGLAIALEELVEMMNKPEKIRIEYYNSVPAGRLPIDIEISIYRIVQELLNNALKHADATVLELKLDITDENIIIRFSDNGIGFQNAGNKDKIEGIGLKNMEARTRIMNGTLDMDTDPENGTRFKIEIPLTTEHINAA